MSALDTEAIAGIVVGSFVLLGLGYSLSKNNKQYNHADENENENADENENVDENENADEDKVSYRKSATLDNMENQYPAKRDKIKSVLNPNIHVKFGEDSFIPTRDSEIGGGKRKSRKSKKSKKSKKSRKSRKSNKRD